MIVKQPGEYSLGETRFTYTRTQFNHGQLETITARNCIIIYYFQIFVYANLGETFSISNIFLFFKYKEIFLFLEFESMSNI